LTTFLVTYHFDSLHTLSTVAFIYPSVWSHSGPLDQFLPRDALVHSAVMLQ